MSMLTNLKKLEAEGKVGGSDYFKPQNGNNIFRVLTEGIHDVNKFGNARFVMFIIDRKDGKVKPYFAPYTVYKAVANLEEDPFYKFEGMPMPYDINLKVENAGTKDVEYSVTASPQNTELTADELAMAREHGSIVEYVAGLKKDGQDANGSSSDGARRRHRTLPAESSWCKPWLIAQQPTSGLPSPDYRAPFSKP
jgi:hypothetical protein